MSCTFVRGFLITAKSFGWISSGTIRRMSLSVRTLALANFRSYESAAFSFAPRTVITGPNASGKTNILEGLYLLASGKSFRADRESEMVRWGETAGRVHAEFARGGARREATAMFSSGGGPGNRTQKVFLVDAKKQRARDLARLFPMVLFSADDARLISGSPGRRRRLLDLAISQGSPEYRAALSRYTRALAGRNHLLERIATGESTAAELAAWDEPLIAAGQTVTRGRQDYFARAEAPLREAYAALTARSPRSAGVATRLTAAYQPLAEDLAAEIPRRCAQDLAIGTTTAGPHRDDWRLLLGNRPLVSFGSGGEFRSAALAWRLAESEWLAAATDTAPIVLLDDVFSELDGFRQESLLTNLPERQVIITTPNTDHLSKRFESGAKIIELNITAVAEPRV